jgi:hypothetical protein
VQGHEIELLDQLTGGRAVPTTASEAGAGGGAAAAGTSGGSQLAPEGEAYRPTTFSFLRSVTLRGSQEEEERREDGEAPALDPVAAEAARRAFDKAVLAQWQRLRSLHVN